MSKKNRGRGGKGKKGGASVDDVTAEVANIKISPRTVTGSYISQIRFLFLRIKLFPSFL